MYDFFVLESPLLPPGVRMAQVRRTRRTAVLSRSKEAAQESLLARLAGWVPLRGGVGCCGRAGCACVAAHAEYRLPGSSPCLQPSLAISRPVFQLQIVEGIAEEELDWLPVAGGWRSWGAGARHANVPCSCMALQLLRCIHPTRQPLRVASSRPLFPLLPAAEDGRISAAAMVEGVQRLHAKLRASVDLMASG